MQAAIWRTIPKLRNPQFSARFHSTPILLAKWKDEGTGHKPSKAQMRFSVRQKRTDSKQALKDFLLYGKSSKLHFQDDDIPGPGPKRSRNSKSQSSASSGRAKHRTWHRKQRHYDLDDDANHENTFGATFGGQKCFTWSFTWSENLKFDNARTGFNVGSESKKERARERFWCESDDDVEEESTNVGCRPHRITLGLPSTGPLKLDDIKCAFRASALKWHPDRHQGSSQAMAEEKFKLCVNAYKSLCSVIKPT